MIRLNKKRLENSVLYVEDTMNTYKCMVKLPNGTVRMVEVQARNPIDAKEMLKGMYGSDRVIGNPMKA